MYAFIFGFQRFVWCPKWTPASSKSFNAMPLKLPPKTSSVLPAPSFLSGACSSLAELEALARPLLPVLLPFLDARVAREEPGLLQPLPQLDVVLDQRARDAETQRPCLAGNAAAGDRREHIELLGRLGDGQRLLDLGAERFGGEGLLDRLAIDD